VLDREDLSPEPLTEVLSPVDSGIEIHLLRWNQHPRMPDTGHHLLPGLEQTYDVIFCSSLTDKIESAI